MTYDDWKTTDDTPQPERQSWCERCQHEDCDCPCCSEPEEDAEEALCPGPKGHEWSYTGTQYGGEDERWGGEGRVLCVHCGADGDA